MIVLSLFIFSMSAILLHTVPAFIENTALSAICGGITLGLGIGLVVRYGGSLDASENAVRRIKPMTKLSAPNVIMVLNFSVLLGAGIVFGWDQAMYSTIAYLLAFEMVKLTIEGFSMHRTVWIVSKRCEDIEEMLRIRFNLEITFLQTDDHPGRDLEKVMVCKVHRLEEGRVKAIVKSMDPDSAIAVDEAALQRRQSFN
ncbi:uncharacterized membrane-anchored protein YitT (DUF2179 family) [Paenibacillus eucommiae]|uniref:Uncharacterized membrane-anchored protein YitT (DUF2179 family) n=2 Tax=Paenibacillus eucommiae TaxID=1355755 RepID=A0ABS4JAW7_9BACL|nr:uncharacterized membrane-anchored protein YitT (DUF2179 family) [Paenibacillus eucommiae]